MFECRVLLGIPGVRNPSARPSVPPDPPFGAPSRECLGEFADGDVAMARWGTSARRECSESPPADSIAPGIAQESVRRPSI